MNSVIDYILVCMSGVQNSPTSALLHSFANVLDFELSTHRSAEMSVPISAMALLAALRALSLELVTSHQHLPVDMAAACTALSKQLSNTPSFSHASSDLQGRRSRLGMPMLNVNHTWWLHPISLVWELGGVSRLYPKVSGVYPKTLL